MFENIGSFFRKIVKPEQKELGSKDAAKERLHLVLMQDRANVSADFLELMKQEIIDVIKKYIIIDESAIDVRLTNQSNEDGTNGAPALYANIPIVNIKNEMIVNKGKNSDDKDVMGTPEYNVKVEKPEENEEEKTGILENIGDKIEEKIDDIKEKIEDRIDEAVNTDVFHEKNEESHDENKIEVEEKEVELEHSEDDEEDDDDVTFDDLLKAAEEEDRKKEKEQKEKASSTEKVQSENTSNTNKGKKRKKVNKEGN